MKRVWSFIFVLLFICCESFGQEEVAGKTHGIEIFPQVIPFRIYSAQYVYGASNNNFILGFTYLNNFYPQKKGAIGQFFAPTVPIGYRRYLWRNLNIEGQLWPAYNFYKDLSQNKFYNGFDLAGSMRFGYRFDFKVMRLPVYTNVQIEYLFGIYKGNKPDNFDDIQVDLPIFPAISLGYKW